MTEYFVPRGPLPPIPDDLTLPQYMLDAMHTLGPANTGYPWMIEVETDRRVGLEELRARTFGLANELNSRFHIGENDVVCIFSTNHIDWPVAVWAVHRLGGIVTTANPAYSEEELVHLLKLTEVSFIISSYDGLETALAAGGIVGIPPERIIILENRPASAPAAQATVEELVRDGSNKMPTFVEKRLSPGEAKRKLAFFCFSSGTTGPPKAVAVAHYAFMANITQLQASLEPKSDRYVAGDMIFGGVPFFHVFGMMIYLHAHIVMGTTVLVARRFVFENFLKVIQQYHVKHTIVVPPVCVLLCKSSLTKNYDLSSLRWLMCSAAPLSLEVANDLNRVLPQCHIAQGYGMTEAFSTIAFPSMDRKLATPGASGELLPGIAARVVKEDGSLGGPSEEGELYISGPSLALGYWKNEAATKETFVDGWLRTGDKVMLNEKYEVFILDRIKELIKVKGFQVAPAELEGHLLSHPDVADACVVGVPHDFSGEVPLAFIVPNQHAADRIAQEPAEAEKIKKSIAKYVADHKVSYKRLEGGVELIEAIPKNPSGKLLRRVLRDAAMKKRADKQLVTHKPSCKL